MTPRDPIVARLACAAAGALGPCGLLPAAPASAQSRPLTLPVDAQLYRLPMDSERLLWADESAGAHPGYTTARLGLGYLSNPVQLLVDGEPAASPLVHGVESNLLVATWLGPVRLGVDLPLWLGQHDCVEELLRGVGDVAVDGKATIWERDEHPVGLAVGGRLQLPTGTVLLLPVTHDGISLETSLVVDRDLGPVRLAVNLGTVSMPSQTIDTVPWDDRYVYRAGAGWAVVESERLGVSAELAGSDPYGDQGGAGHAAEWMLGGWGAPHPDWRLQLGVGRGLTPAIGSPDLRGIFALSWVPPRAADADGDGIPNRLDACRDLPEDIDQYSDSDGCPDQAAIASVVASATDDSPLDGLDCRFQLGDEVVPVSGTSSGDLHPGTWSLTCSAPDFETQTVQVEVTESDPEPTVAIQLEPAIATVQLRVTGLDGAPLGASVAFADGTHLAVVDGRADLVLGKGSHSFQVSAPAHFPVPVSVDLSEGELNDILVQLDSALAERTEQGVRLLGAVKWRGDTAQLQPSSIPVLDDVAGLLLGNLTARSLQVAVATNDRADARQNQELGAARAATIVAILAARGVDPTHLQAVGLAPGEDAVRLSWMDR